MVLAEILPYINTAMIAPTTAAVLTFMYQRHKLQVEQTASGRDADRAEIGRLHDLVTELQAAIVRQGVEFGEELTRQRRAFEEDLAKSRRDCEEDQRRLRDNIRSLHDEMTGLRRQRQAEQMSAAVLIAPPDAKTLQAIERLGQCPAQRKPDPP